MKHVRQRGIHSKDRIALYFSYLINSFDRLPERIQTAIFTEMGLGSAGSVKPASQAEIDDLAGQPEWDSLIREWRGKAPRNVAIVLEKLGRIEERLSEELRDILCRLATVFEQTYTRFLDLKTAEEQAELIRLEKERLEETLSELKATQSQLIQSEKMASLGELTAGIAHEIQNPLNFVNNFSDVSGEMIEEINEELENGDIEEVKEILNDLKGNLKKIHHHGGRASSIVRSMLDHSRASSAERVATDINALSDEYIRLAYHGLRAKDRSFHADFKTEFDESLPKIKIAPQDIGRVVLNILNNAFYAVNEKKKQSGDNHYSPSVSIATSVIEKEDFSKVVITITDNGIGMSEEILEKIFQPFFTTKPTGQGTGLGMSLAYDIVKAHGGELTVESKEGEGSEFVIKLPKD